MEKLSIEKVNYGDHYVERSICERLKKFDGGTIIMTDNHIRVQNANDSLDTPISFYERDPFTVSWTGKYEDGTQFRIVKPNPQFLAITGNTVTFGSMYHDGYAVHFKIS